MTPIKVNSDNVIYWLTSLRDYSETSGSPDRIELINFAIVELTKARKAVRDQADEIERLRKRNAALEQAMLWPHASHGTA